MDVLHQDEIDQWVVVANGNGTAHRVWHRRLLENKGAVLKTEVLASDQDGAKAIVDDIVARFLTPMLNATATMPTAGIACDGRAAER